VIDLVNKLPHFSDSRTTFLASCITNPATIVCRHMGIHFKLRAKQKAQSVAVVGVAKKRNFTSIVVDF